MKMLFLLLFLLIGLAETQAYRAQNETYMCRSAENVVKVRVSISYVLSAEMAVQNEAFT